MLNLGIVIAGALIGADTGLCLRRLIAQTRTEADNWLPSLAALAPLVVGIAIIQSVLLALLQRWAHLSYVISGPLLVIYGFVWFQNSIAVHRLSPATHGSPHQSHPIGSAWNLSVLPRIGLGMQMGLLLCAVGARDLATLLSSLLVALLAATVPHRLDPTLGATSDLLRCGTGAMLFAIGAGVVLSS